jgi:hypothetical protein
MTENDKVKIVITTKEDIDFYEQEQGRMLNMTYKERENLINCLAKEWNLRFGLPIDDERIKEEFREGNIDIMSLCHYFDKEKLPDDNSYREFYYRKKFWTVEEASILLLDMNPEKIDLAELHKINTYFVINQYNDYLKLLRDTFDAERVLVKDVIDWSNQNQIKLPKSMQVFFKTEPIDLEEKCRKLEAENKEIKTEKDSIILTLKNENQNLEGRISSISIDRQHKRLTCLYKGFIGLLALHYKRDKILQSFGRNAGGVNPNNKLLIRLNKIKEDLDLQGINLDDGTIKKLIKASISYLEEKSK